MKKISVRGEVQHKLIIYAMAVKSREGFGCMRLCRSQRPTKTDRAFRAIKKKTLKKTSGALPGAENVLALFDAVFVRYFHRILCISSRGIRAHVSSFNTEAHDDLNAKRVLSPQSTHTRTLVSSHLLVLGE